MHIRVRIIATGLALLLMASLVAAQKTLKVPSEFKTIQAAINAAAATNTVLVASGTYLENIDFQGKAILVRGESGMLLTTIKAISTLAPVVTFAHGEGHDSVLEGFTITGGLKGGIRIFESRPHILRCRITKNRADVSKDRAFGGGISILNENKYSTLRVLIDRCEIGDNICDSGAARYSTGGGVGVVGRFATTDIISCRIHGNICTANPNQYLYPVMSGGGVGADYYANCYVTNSLILWNRCAPKSAKHYWDCQGGGTANINRLLHCTVFGNEIVKCSSFDAAGIYECSAVGSIIRQNKGGPEVKNGPGHTLTCCNVLVPCLISPVPDSGNLRFSNN